VERPGRRLPGRRPEPWSLLVNLIATVVWLANVGGSEAQTLSPTLSGSVEYETFGYPDSAAQSPRWENFFTFLARGKGRFAPALTYEFEGRAVADDVGFTAGAYSLRNAGTERPYLSLVTATVTYRPHPDLRISIGKQIVNWSIFDGLQPANLIIPRDESDIFRPVNLGVPGVAVHYESGGAYADLMVVPMAFNPSRLPQGRWSIIPGIVEQRQDLPPVRFNETQAGARLGAHLGMLDASIVGYVGRDTSAIFVPNLIFVGGEEIFKLQIIDRYPHMRAGGVTAAYSAIEGLLLRVESVYYNSQDRDRDDFVHTAAGIEYAIENWRLVLNYMREDLTFSAPEEVTDKGERQFFQSFIFGELRYDPGGRLRAKARAGYDLSKQFVLAEPEVSYRVWRDLRVALFSDLIGAGRFSYFDRIRHEDRLGTRLEYHF
jgi:hypothetical protein